jgi:hypothetical protein
MFQEYYKEFKVYNNTLNLKKLSGIAILISNSNTNHWMISQKIFIKF